MVERQQSGGKGTTPVIAMENMQTVKEEMGECLLDSDDEGVYLSSQDENYHTEAEPETEGQYSEE